MRRKRNLHAAVCGLLAGCCLLPALAVAQSAEPQCTSVSAAEREANKQLVLDFFSSKKTLERRAEQFMAKDYVQHNPRFLRMDEITGASGRDAWVEALKAGRARGISLVDLGGIKLVNPVILMAECDLVTAIYRGTLADPDHPERSYEAFAFETFRVRDGKFTEHWDQVQLAPGWQAGATSAQQ